MKNNIRAFAIFFFVQLSVVSQLWAFPDGKDWNPEKVVPANECIRCHQEEGDVWKGTKHFATYGDLHKGKRAKEIATEFGLPISKIRNPDSVCAGCHYTVGSVNGSHRVVQGISCQSCHGEGADWLEVHNNYGSDTATKSSESAAHKAQRIKAIEAAGMVRPANYLGFAQNCYQCHLVANEDLINKTTHRGASDFSFLERTQGNILHSEPANIDKQNKLIISGAIVEVAGALFALGNAKDVSGRYAQEMTQTASGAIKSLESAADATNDAQLLKIHSKLKGIQLKAGDAALVSLSKEIMQTASGALGTQGSLHKATVASPITKPKKEKSSPIQPKAKTSAVGSESRASTTASKTIVSSSKASAVASVGIVGDAETELAPSQVVAANLPRIVYFNLVSPPFNELCASRNPWAHGWVDSALLPQRPECVGFLLNAPLKDNLILLKRQGEQVVKLHSSSCLVLAGQGVIESKGHMQLLPSSQWRISAVDLDASVDGFVIVAVSHAARSLMEGNWNLLIDSCGSGGSSKYSDFMSLLSFLSAQFPGQIDWKELDIR